MSTCGRLQKQAQRAHLIRDYKKDDIEKVKESAFDSPKEIKKKITSSDSSNTCLISFRLLSYIHMSAKQKSYNQLGDVYLFLWRIMLGRSREISYDLIEDSLTNQIR